MVVSSPTAIPTPANLWKTCLRVIQVTSDLDERLRTNHMVNSSDAHEIRGDAQLTSRRRPDFFRRSRTFFVESGSGAYSPYAAPCRSGSRSRSVPRGLRPFSDYPRNFRASTVRSTMGMHCVFGGGVRGWG